MCGLIFIKINEINKLKMKWVGRPKNSAAARTKGGIARTGTGTRPPTTGEVGGRWGEGREVAGRRERAV